MFRNVCALWLVFVLILPGAVHAQDKPQVVASFSILADVVRQVTGDEADVSSLLPVDSDPHSYDPSPQDIIALAEADIIFLNGALFEEGLLESIENAGENMNLVEVSQCVEILAVGGDHDEENDEHVEVDEHVEDTATPVGAQCASHHTEVESIMGEHEHHAGAEVLGRLYELECGDEDHADDDHEDEAEHEHEAGSCDPHVWTTVENVMLWTLYIRDTFSDFDPDHATIYAENANAYLAELGELQEYIEGAVATIPEENRVLLTNHETLGYFAAAYGFEIIGTVLQGGGTANEPGAAEIRDLIDTIREHHAPAIFAENTVNPDLAEQIAAETGASMPVLYSDSLSDGDPAGTYIDYMRVNVETIVQALQG
ncbi:MAG TPA: zinc ABC transporter substrate-binding protein [Aggregatilineales bacterium]|nr:zinc ABC transporter substrate-binding protein [Aggregatilineales bacterium]